MNLPHPASSSLRSFLTRSPKEFWGVEVKVDQSLELETREEYIHISQVALGEAVQDTTSEPVVLFLNADHQKFVLGTLVRDEIPNLSLNVWLNLSNNLKKFELSHTSRNASVYFSGSKICLARDPHYNDDDLLFVNQENDNYDDIPMLDQENDNDDDIPMLDQEDDNDDDLPLVDQENVDASEGLEDITATQSFENAKKLVDEGKTLALNNIHDLKGCLEKLSEAISIMEQISISKWNLTCYSLSEAYCLRILCLQKEKPESEQIFIDANAALDLWQKIYSMDCSDDSATISNISILFYNIIDLLHLKGFLQLSDKMHSLIIKIFEQKRVERKKWLTLLWETRRLNHACCISPINETFVCKFNDARIWLQDLQESQLAFIGFQQSFSFNGETLSPNLGVDVPTVDEVIANLHGKGRHSTFVSAYIYLDLSRRFSSNGELAEALLTAKKAQTLFKEVFVKSTREIDPLISNELAVCLSNPESKDFEDSYLSPWKTMQGFLECILQLGIIFERMGDAVMSETYLRKGKEMSNLFHFPLFMVAFSTLLGKLYAMGCSPKLSNISTSIELTYALKCFEENNGALGCSKCKSMLSCGVYQILGDEAQLHDQVHEAEEHYTKVFHEIYNDGWKSTIICPENVNDTIAVNTGHIDKRCSCSILTENATNEESESIKIKCWFCLPSVVIKSELLENLIDLKWELFRRHLSLELHSRIGKIKADTNQIEEASKTLLKGVANFVGRDFSHAMSPISKDCFSILVAATIPEDAFVVERARLIYDICWCSLKYYSSDFRSKIFSDGSSVTFATLASWLRVAFVLSREFPDIFQKVSRLLAVMYILSCYNEQFSLSAVGDDIDENFAAAYFLQWSIGAHLTNKFHSKFSERLKGQSVIGSSSTKQETFDLFGLVPKATKDLADHMKKVLVGHPSFTITSISILGWDYINLLRALPISPPLPKHARALMLISRLNFKSEPIVILLPLDSSQQDVSNNIINKDSVVDDILPNFRTIIEGRMPDGLQMTNGEYRDLRDQWLGTLLSDTEYSWLGSWRCFLLGELQNINVLDPVFESLASKGKHVGKLTKDLLKTILGGIESGEMLSSKKECYIAKIGSDGWDSILDLLSNTANVQEVRGSLNRKPVVLVVDYELQTFPWENFPIARKQEMYRMPSVSSIFTVLHNGSNQEQVAENTISFPSIDPFNAFYILNPENQKIDVFDEMEQKYIFLHLKGKSGSIPTVEEVVSALDNHDLFIYIGHGDGTQYNINSNEIQKLERCAGAFIMGCHSGAFSLHGNYAPTCPSSIAFLLAGSPFIVAHLWSVTCLEMVKYVTNLYDEFFKERSGSCLHKRTIGVYMLDARDTCVRPNFKSAVCYGLPTEICHKSSPIYSENATA